jgi:FkbM family methyltransferase
MRNPSIAVYCPHRFVQELPPDKLVYVGPWIDLRWNIWNPTGIGEGPLVEWSIDQLMPEGKKFVDIGSNIGVYTMNYAASPKVEYVYAFDANDEMVDCLRLGLGLNGLARRATVHHVALGSPEQAKEGVIVFHHVPTSSGESTTFTGVVEVKKLAAVDRVVECRTLDSYELPNVGLIKLDVEGAELDVIKGAVGTLEANGWPKMFMEVWPLDWYKPRKAELFKFLASIGYDRIVEIGQGQSYDMFIAERTTS